MRISPKKLYSLLLACFALFAFVFMQDLAPATNESPVGTYVVTEVVDGDTIAVRMGEEDVKVRLLGLDTPETVDPRREVQCFGQEASAMAKSKLLGENVRLEDDKSQADKDKYGRLLRYVYLPDGTLFNKWLIANGYGFEYTYNSNPHRYQADFQAAEDLAREQGLGLWAKTACNGEVKNK
jgi:micrococcal nuclease